MRLSTYPAGYLVLGLVSDCKTLWETRAKYSQDPAVLRVNTCAERGYEGSVLFV